MKRLLFALAVTLAATLAACGVAITTSTFKIRVDCVMNGGRAPGYTFGYGFRTDRRSVAYPSYTYTTPAISGLDFTMSAQNGLKSAGVFRCDFTVLSPNSQGRDAPGTVLGHKTLHSNGAKKVSATVHITLVSGKVGID